MDSSVSDTKLPNVQLAPRQYENNNIAKRGQDCHRESELLVS